MGPLIWLVTMLTGCCGTGDPSWLPIEPVYLDGQATTFDLSPYVLDDRDPGRLVLEADGAPDVIAEVSGSRLTLTPQPGWRGEATVRLVATDACDNTGVTVLQVSGAEAPDGPGPGDPGDCSTVVVHRPEGSLGAVAIAGTFNDWDAEAHPLEEQSDGSWSVILDLDPGSYAYKLVEDGQWRCDPAASAIQCDAGFPEPSDTQWQHSCAPGEASCNSLLEVPACGPPRLEVISVDSEVGSGRLAATVSVRVGSGGAIVDAQATLDGEPIDGAWDGERFEVAQEGLDAGRHRLQFEVTDAGGNVSDPAVVPVWLDGHDPQAGLMYFAFVDRVANGDPSNDGAEGATAGLGDYEGGDFAGLVGLLPYLDDLGVTVLWISNAQGNAQGAHSGSCGLTYTGYHAYWPDESRGVESHFGTGDELVELIEAAHARGMRVVMDWVANHVFEAHPYAIDHPEWFTPYAGCTDSVDGQSNFDRLPETCWFAPYLPDFDYSRPDVLTAMVDDAIWWASTYDLDGLRVDAVKHMSRAVPHNLASEVEARLEHRTVGGTTDFWTVGETFDGSRERIAAYVGSDRLDAQFDFPLYFTIRDVFAGGAPMGDALAAVDASAAVYGDAVMSPFLGNHDVNRFVTQAAEGDFGVCDGASIRHADPPIDAFAYDRLRLAWSFLFTQPGVPLVYYGDEIGMPGNGDPDNRQPLWWHTGDLGGGVSSVDDLAARVAANPAAVVRHVAALSGARAEHPAFYSGQRVEWWAEPDLMAYSRSEAGDHLLVILNRGDGARTLSNGLAFAGLPATGTWVDVLTDQVFVPAGDTLTVEVDGRGSRVLVWR